MVQYATLQVEIAKTKALVKEFDTALSLFSTNASSVGATASSSIAFEEEMKRMRNKINVNMKTLADLNASLTS